MLAPNPAEFTEEYELSLPLILRMGGGTLNPLELHDCELGASTDILSTSAAPESLDSFPGLEAGNGAFSDKWSDWCATPWADGIDGVEDAFWRVAVAQLFGEKNIFSACIVDDSGAFLFCGDSFESIFSIWLWLALMFEPPSFFFVNGLLVTSKEWSFCVIFGWFRWFCSCLKFLSDPSKSRRLVISFLMSFNRSRSAANDTEIYEIAQL